MQTSVRQDRHLYIGASDIPCIMGISPFKTRFDLLLEKAQLVVNEFEGNEYTEYGNIMEPKIRNYLNQFEDEPLIEGKFVKGIKRVHTDGENSIKIVEIKTTSKIYKTLRKYKIYMVQLLFAMMLEEKRFGKLAVYKRPKDFDTNFNKDFLQTFDFEIDEFKDWVEEIEIAVKEFLVDLDKVKNNPLIEEYELNKSRLEKQKITTQFTNKIELEDIDEMLKGD